MVIDRGAAGRQLLLTSEELSMSALANIVTGGGVNVEQMLAARDQRAARQTSALGRFQKPLVSMTVVAPGPFKDGPLAQRVLEVAHEELENLARARNWHVLWRNFRWQRTGPEAMYVIDVDAQVLKQATIELEDGQPLGRLWDLDVIAPGPRLLSRKQL
jgi:holo-ACP synthase